MQNEEEHHLHGLVKGEKIWEAHSVLSLPACQTSFTPVTNTYYSSFKENRGVWNMPSTFKSSSGKILQVR